MAEASAAAPLSETAGTALRRSHLSHGAKGDAVKTKARDGRRKDLTSVTPATAAPTPASKIPLAVTTAAGSKASRPSLKWRDEIVQDWRNVDYDRVRTAALCGGGVLAIMLMSRYVVYFPILLQMTAYTTSILITASQIALRNHVEAQQALAKSKEMGTDASDSADDERRTQVEVISRSEAAQFPFIASGMIFGMYMALKYLPKYWVNLLLSSYVSLGATYAIYATVSDGLYAAKVIKRPELAPGAEGPVQSYAQKRSIRVRTRLLRYVLEMDKFEYRFSVVEIVSLAIAIACSAGWLTTKAWILHNLCAIAFCVQAICMISVGTFGRSVLLLTGLFFYDIFWVFKTDVMVTVATGFDAPAKLLFPRAGKFSLLGLGDIVIPGIFIAMTLRFDHAKRKEEFSKTVVQGQDEARETRRAQQEGSGSASGESGPALSPFYFRSAMICYTIALIMSGWAMFYFDHAQPALLYLVPALVLSLYVPAVFKGDIRRVFNYTEDPPEPEGEQATDQAAQYGNDDSSVDAENDEMEVEVEGEQSDSSA